MSYAAAAAKNRLPPDQQPQPDPNLLEGDHSSEVDLSHSTATDEKVHVVTREEFEQEVNAPEEPPQPEPVLLTADDAPAAAPASAPSTAEASKKAQDTKEKVKSEAKKDVAEAEKQLDKAAKAAKEEYEQLSEKAQAAYNKMSKEAREDWHKLSKESKKRWEQAKNSEAAKELQKPEVWGSILGVANLAVLGSVVYFTVTNWKKPHWDRRVVSATVIGVGTWFGLQGWLIPQTDAVKQKRR